MTGRWGREAERGLTLLELVLASALLAILAASVLPLYEVTVKREREIELRRALRDIRRAIDAFHQSYVASGGALSQGGTQPGPQGGFGGNLPGQSSQPVGLPGTGGQRNRSGAPGQPQAQPGPGGTAGDVPLIDVSQFDPVDSKGYPPDLLTLVEGVQAYGGGTEEEDLVKFLRRIPLDPMTPADTLDSNDKNFGWQVCCYQDPADCRMWCRKNVWDVRSKSQGKALDGKSKYSEW